MSDRIRVMLVGETWIMRTMEVKGADSFEMSSYGTGKEYLEKAVREGGFDFIHIPCHCIGDRFPASAEELKKMCDVLIISDVGANTFLLPVETFLQSKKTPNKLEIIKQYVEKGGGLCMVGGYMSFMGIDGKGRYHQTPVEEVLPVEFQPFDDRQEHPEGIEIAVPVSDHPILQDLPERLTGILGYNRAIAKKSADVLLSYENDPILAVGTYGTGRCAAYATDCAPHWSSPEFSDSDAYRSLWKNMVLWLSREAG